MLDEAAVLTAMTYADLNPIRAVTASMPEKSEFTSIEQRIREYKTSSNDQINTLRLMELTAKDTRHTQTLRFSIQDYFSLIDWTGRAILRDKRGAIPDDIPPILQRLGIESKTYLAQIAGTMTSFFTHSTALGIARKLEHFAEKSGRAFVRGWKQRQALYI